MIVFPFSKRWFNRSVLQSLNSLHVGSCDLFPHEGLTEVGGSRIFGRSQLTRKLRSLLAQIIERVPKCGWSDSFESEFIELCRLADGFIDLINQAKQRESNVADSAARHFYLACGVAWHLASSLNNNICVDHESTLEPFDRLLVRSGVSECWNSQDLSQTNSMLKRRLEQLLTYRTSPKAEVGKSGGYGKNDP